VLGIIPFELSAGVIIDPVIVPPFNGRYAPDINDSKFEESNIVFQLPQVVP
jgi:hypothetical protein